MSPAVTESILVILPNNLGDIIMATPVLSGFKARYPLSRITFLVESGNEAGIAYNPDCDEIFTFPRRDIRTALGKADGHEGLAQLRTQLQAIGTTKFDRVLNLSQILYVSYLMPLLKAQLIAGQHFLSEGNHAITDPWSQYLYAIPFARHYNRLHASDVYRRIADVRQHAGYTICIETQEKDRAAAFLKSKGVDPALPKTVVFQPGASVPAKRWPAEHFVALGQLMTDAGWQIIVSGAPSELDLAEAIAVQIGSKATCTAGETSFRQAIANLSFARACVTGDTALMHAAAALQVPVYALFGSTSPVETGPYGDGHWVLSGKCTNRPCFCSICKSQLCMKSITPGVVFSCIVHGFANTANVCDVFRTELEPNGDYRLVPQGRTLMPYFSQCGSALTQRAFEEFSMEGPQNEDDFPQHREESLAMTATLREMHRLLQNFLDTRDSASISAFEERKKSLSDYSGIGAFWSALLNLRLNSVPILDPVRAVAGSAEACLQTANQLQLLWDGQ